MSAAITDKFADTYNAANPNVARVTSTRAAAASSLACDNLAGWPTNTVVHFSTYKIDTSNNIVAGSQIDWEGIVSGTSIGTMTRITGAADAGNAVGDVVEMNPTAKWASNLVNGILVQHNQDGTHGAVTATSVSATSVTTSGAVLTTPKVITSINDTNGNALVNVTATASAVNQLTVANSATGAGPTISATGTDTNIDYNISPKGTGAFKVGGNPFGHGAWKSWTPTAATGSFGTGATVTGAYQQYGKTVIARMTVTVNAASLNMTVTIAPPVTAATAARSSVCGNGVYTQSSAPNDYFGVVLLDGAGNFSPRISAVSTPGRADSVTNANPFAWTTGDLIRLEIMYEAA